MSVNNSGRKAQKLVLASLAVALAAVPGAVLVSGPAAAQAKPAAASPGRALFTDWSCGSCHILKDAGGTGRIGPKLDGAKYTKAFVVGRITKGQGAMPGFGGSLTAKEIDVLSTYITAESKK